MRSLALRLTPFGLCALVGCAGTSSNASHSNQTPPRSATSSGVPGANAGVHVTLRRVLVDEIDRAPDPSRVLPPEAGAEPEDAALRRSVIDGIEGQRATVAQCYRQVRVAQTDALGDVTVDLSTDASGSVHDVLLRPEPVLEPARGCIEHALRSVTIHPAPGREVGVHLVYRFQPHGATVQESRYRLAVHGATASPAPTGNPPACVPLVLEPGFVSDNSEDEARRFPSLPPWDHAQRERLMARFAGLHDCYARLLAHTPGANGAVQVRIVLAADGLPASIRADGPDALHDVAECARVAVTGTRFCPGPDNATTILLTGIEFLPQ